VLSRSPGFIALSVRTVADLLSVRFDSRGLPLRLRSVGSLIASLGKFPHRVCFLGALPKTGTDKIERLPGSSASPSARRLKRFNVGRPGPAWLKL